MNAIDHTAFRLPSAPTAETLATVQGAADIHALYFSLLTVSAVIDGVVAQDRHVQAYSEMVDRDLDSLAASARAKLGTVTDERDRSLLRRIVLDHEMRCELPGEDFQPLVDQAAARIAA